MPGQPRVDARYYIAHEDLLNALYQALEVESEEERSLLSERYFQRLTTTPDPPSTPATRSALHRWARTTAENMDISAEGTK